MGHSGLVSSALIPLRCASPVALGIISGSHKEVHRLYPLIEKVNMTIQVRSFLPLSLSLASQDSADHTLLSRNDLLRQGFSRKEAARPRLLVEQVRTTGVQSWHSKTLLAISKDGETLFALEGSGNPSNRGFGGTKTTVHGAALEGSSHETCQLLTMPANCTVARTILAEANTFRLFLLQDRRILPTTPSTTKPIRQSDAVRPLQEELQAAESEARISALRSSVEKEVEKAWTAHFEVSASPTLSSGS